MLCWHSSVKKGSCVLFGFSTPPWWCASAVAGSLSPRFSRTTTRAEVRCCLVLSLKSCPRSRSDLPRYHAHMCCTLPLPLVSAMQRRMPWSNCYLWPWPMTLNLQSRWVRVITHTHTKKSSELSWFNRRIGNKRTDRRTLPISNCFTDSDSAVGKIALYKYCSLPMQSKDKQYDVWLC